MVPQRILLVTIISLCTNFIQVCASQSTGQSICTSLEIFNDNVASCTCRQFQTPACKNQCQISSSSTSCPNTPSEIYLDNCASNCTSSTNSDCDACGIWLSGLCECLKPPTTKCERSSQTGLFWVQLEDRHLATVNEPIPNIVDLQRHSELARVAWDFGQKSSVSDLTSEALAINPARTITQYQIHMHICPFNTDMREFLSQQSRPSSLTPIPLPKRFQAQSGPKNMWCLASKMKHTPLSGTVVSGAINEVLQMKSICDYDVAAAVIKDKNDYIWACVTADSLDAEHKFMTCP